MLNFNGMCFPIDVTLACIRWYASYPLSYLHLEEMMDERGVSIDRLMINRWTIRFLPLTEKMASKYERAVGGSWAWMRSTSRSRAPGNTFIKLSTSEARPSTSF
jgi:putative transposase